MTCFVSVITSAPGCIPHSSYCYHISKRSELMEILREELNSQGFPKHAIADFAVRRNWPAISKGRTWSRDSYHNSPGNGGHLQMTASTITEQDYRSWYLENHGQTLDEGTVVFSAYDLDMPRKHRFVHLWIEGYDDRDEVLRRMQVHTGSHRLRWIQSLGGPNPMLWMVVDPDGRTMGYIGLPK